jgi:hypothetical protein
MSQNGYIPNKEKVCGLLFFISPYNSFKLCQFLSMMNFYWNHIKNFANTAAVLYPSLSKFELTEAHKQAFLN